MYFETNRKSLLEFATACFCACFFLFLLGPLNIFLNNYDSFTISLIDLLVYLSLIAGGLTTLLFGMLFLMPSNIKKVSVRVLALALLVSWVNSSFLYGDYGRIDGQELFIAPLSFLNLWQTAAFGALFYLAVKMNFGNACKVIYLTFLIGMISSVVGIASLDQKTRPGSESGFHSGMTELSPTKNVLHVVLDTLQSDLFYAAIESDEELKQKFDGFTFFKNTLSIYPSTEMSLAAMTTGQVYRNVETKKEFLESLSKESNGVRLLKDKGYELNAHTACHLGVISRCTPISPLVLDKSALFVEAIQLLDLYIFKSVPDFFKPYIYQKGDWLLLNLSSFDSRLKVPIVGLANLLFEKFVDELKISKSRVPRYIFFHSLLTHDPVRLDAKCEIVRQSEILSLSRVEFVKCGIGNFARLLEKMKLLSVYDNTMIVFSSDHGSIWDGGPFNAYFIEKKGINKELVSLASATLLIKPFNVRGAMKITNAPTSLLDIPITILIANGISANATPTGPFAPRSALEVSPGETRTREYLHYKWVYEDSEKSKLPQITVYQIDGDIKDPFAWSDPREKLK